MDRQPPGGRLELVYDDDFTLADSYTLADDLTFERSNPDSVWSCFALGRENARQMRHCISAEVWISLNLAYLRIQKLDMRDIWTTSPEDFYAETAAEINTISGVASATMYRDDGWRFLRLGHFLERAQLTSALLLAHLSAAADDGRRRLRQRLDESAAVPRRFGAVQPPARRRSESGPSARPDRHRPAASRLAPSVA